jgi:hypothetical protein
MAAPSIILGQFALNKVIAHFRNGHSKMASLKRIRINLPQQSSDCFAGGIRIWVLAERADHSLAVDALPIRSPVRPTELPNIWTALPTTPD